MRLKIGKTRVTVGFAFAAAVCALLTVDESGVCAVSLAASVFHECGHLLCMMCLGYPPEKVELFACGMRISESNQSRCVQREIAVALSGPAMNFAAGLFLFWLHLKNGADIRFAAVNFLIGAFNMLPCVPLDAGRILSAVLSRFYEAEKTELIMLRISAVLAVSVFFAGIFVIIYCNGNFSLLAVGAYLTVSVWVNKKRLPNIGF